MGINGLNQFLKNKCPKVFKEISLKTFKGRRISIDANNWMHVNMYFANSKVSNRLNILQGETLDHPTVVKAWLDSCLQFVSLWLEYEITPIFVFDGKYPEEKNDTQQERRDRKTKIRSDIEKNKDILKTNPENFMEIVATIKKLMGQDTSVGKEDIELMIQTLTDLGIPVQIAETEAEKHCAYLCIRGFSDLVFTSDTDAMCFGTPMMISKFERRDNDVIVTVLEIKEILKELDLTSCQFIDLCIMAGCDYNTNMKGIGIGKGYQMLKKNGSIEKIDPKFDITCLKVEVCRKLFTHNDCNIETEKLKICPEIFIEKGRNTLKSFGLENNLNKLIPLIIPGRRDLLEL